MSSTELFDLTKSILDLIVVHFITQGSTKKSYI